MLQARGPARSKWNGKHILEVQKEILNITKNDKYVVNKSLTKKHIYICEAKKEPSMKIMPDDTNKPKNTNGNGKEWSIIDG